MRSNSNNSKTSSPPLDGRALFYMALLAVQFGIQPILTRNFAAPGINKSTVILTQEIVKFGLAFLMLSLSGGREKALKGEMNIQLGSHRLSAYKFDAAVPLTPYTISLAS